MITGHTGLIAHIGYPTHSFKSPQIYNPHFERSGIDVVVVPMGCHAAHYPALLRSVFQLSNLRGALITMPHKISTVQLVDELSPAARVAGACNAVRRLPDGRLQGDQFDGEGFVRGARRHGVRLQGASALVVGCGGVGSAIAASLAGAGVAGLRLFDAQPAQAAALAQRLAQQHPALRLQVGLNDPSGMDVVVNATPLGMEPTDPLPVDVTQLSPSTFVGEVVMSQTHTPLLRAALAKGCAVQVGTDMLFEQIPAYLEFFGFPSATPQALREAAQLDHKGSA